MKNIPKFLINLIISLFLSKKFDCFPIVPNDDVLPLEIRAHQNPHLFGGDIMGVNMSSIDFWNALPNDNRLWPLGTIPYVIDKSLEDNKAFIMHAMNQYHQNTCISCFSFVGRTGGKQLLSLGRGCDSIGTAVHELGHSVGFFHEHQRSDRDSYLRLFQDNIAQRYRNQFNILGDSDNRLLVKFDFDSIMLYGQLTYSKDAKSVTMLPKEQFINVKMLEVYQKYGLSDTDIKAIQLLYQC